MQPVHSLRITQRRRWLLPALGGLLLSGCGQQADDGTADVDNYLRNGQAYLEQHQFRAAMIEATNAVRLAPEADGGPILLARIHNRLGRPREAIRLLEELNGDKSPDYYLTLARAYVQRGKYQSALKLLAQQQELKGHPEYALMKAQALAGLNRLDEADAAYTALLTAQPQLVEGRLGQAAIALRRGEPNLSHQLTDQLLGEHPQQVDALLFKAQLLFRQKRLEEAEHFYSEALANAPAADLFTRRRAAILAGLSETLTLLGRSSDALIYSRILADAFPDAREISELYDKALAAFRQADYAEAATLLAQVQAQAPGHDASATLLGIVRYLQGDIAAANAQLAAHLDPEVATSMTKQIYALSNLQLNKPDAVLTLLGDEIDNSRDPELIALYGVAALRQGDAATGVAKLRQAMALAPDNLRLPLILAGHYNGQQPPATRQAQVVLEQALRRQPDAPLLQSAQIRQYLIDQQIDLAKDYVKGLLKTYSERAATWQLAGFFFHRIEHWPDARRAFDKAIALSPDDINNYWGLAKTAMAQQQWPQAQAAYQEILTRAPDDITVYQGLLKLYEKQQRTAAGLEQLEELAAQGNSDAPGLVLSQYYAEHREFETSARFLEQARQKAPNSTRAERQALALQFQQAQQAIRQQDYDRARQLLERSAAGAPDDARRLGLLAETETKAGRFIEAQAYLDRLRSAHPSLSLADVLAGDLALRRQDGRAGHYYRQAWQRQPTDTVAVRLYTLLKRGDNGAEADAFLNDWIEQLPQSFSARMNIAASSMSKGQNATAISQYEHILSQHSDSVVALNNLAWLYFKQGDPRALATARQAYELSKTNSSVLDTYGWLLFKAGQAQQAVSILDEAARLSPDNQVIIGHLAEARAAKAL